MRLAALSSVLGFAALLVLGVVGCVEEARPVWLGGTLGLPADSGSSVAGSNTSSDPVKGSFTRVPISSRTFVDGRVVVTATYNVSDIDRTPLQIDFNQDGRIDAVVAYQQGTLGVLQILMSYGLPGASNYVSLTLDGGDNDWENLSDVAVGDIDGDGLLDIVLAATDGVVYLRHPSDPTRTQVLSEWGAETGALEIIDGTVSAITSDELDGILATTLGATFDRSPYIVTVKEGYSSVELGDFDNDRDNDIIASRSIAISLTPKPDTGVQPISITGGSLQVLVNPGNARDGQFWTGVSIGLHERHAAFDRQGGGDLRAVDLDGDGDLDVVSVAVDDQNVQVSWFENPGGPGALDPFIPWLQHRIGSLRGASQVDVADLTGDGRIDVVGVSAEEMRAVLFVQPEEGPARGYDWFSTPIVEFKNYEPRAIQALDVDNDGKLEVVIGGTQGAVRYFQPGSDPLKLWGGVIMTDFDPPGEVGLLGYGDIDLDGDLDLIAVVSGEDAEANQVSWIRNDVLRR